MTVELSLVGELAVDELAAPATTETEMAVSTAPENQLRRRNGITQTTRMTPTKDRTTIGVHPTARSRAWCFGTPSIWASG
jgi:hypothetical protein